MPKKTPIASVILAAGKGTRMKSELPKALHTVCGEPMLGFLIRRAIDAGSKKIIVVGGHQIGKVRDFLKNFKTRVPVTLIDQKEQLGSGHAVKKAAQGLKGFKGSVFIFYCDTPLISVSTVKALLKNHQESLTDCTLLSVDLDQPYGYGRIKRNDDGKVQSIIEEVNASVQEKRITEINVGAYIFKADKLLKSLGRIQKDPVKKEYYLTDVVKILAQEGSVEAVVTPDSEEVLGVNSPRDLAWVEEIAQRKILEYWMDQGVRIRDPKSTTIDAGVRIGQGTLILPGTVIEEGSVIGKYSTIGPCARIRGNSQIGDFCTVGNFVEVVRSKIGARSQVKHLTYLGDAQVGTDVNIGAGTITANYDGKHKHQTVIKDRARIGSGTILVAPVSVGKGAVTGAGTVVPKNKNIKDGETVFGVPARVFKKK